MPRKREQIVLDLKKLRGELNKTDDQALRRVCMEGIDSLLDERLEERGVHPADCSCHECTDHVARVLSRRVAELSDPRGIASPGEW